MILIRNFEDDFDATDFANKAEGFGFTLVGVAVASVSADRDTRRMVPAIVVTMQWTRPVRPVVSVCRALGIAEVPESLRMAA